ncbi:hypothetical protein MK805_09260 [Shimazuella sp. AN120528]|uniref:hypothetical protein n=1 Tax=Shimazuella soli TaxID=1892854 RepID=UPI001F0F6528|nr:hypothetical protein [Shimazuella soli]MCH5585157.1 hypothetical protein [Shimazuella soli]
MTSYCDPDKEGLFSNSIVDSTRRVVGYQDLRGAELAEGSRSFSIDSPSSDGDPLTGENDF